MSVSLHKQSVCINNRVATLVAVSWRNSGDERFTLTGSIHENNCMG